MEWGARWLNWGGGCGSSVVLEGARGGFAAWVWGGVGRLANEW